MMKRLTGILASSLIVFMALSTPVFANGLVNSGKDVETVQAQTKILTYSVRYTGKVTPSSTYDYNQGGWRGTLSLVGSAYDGTYTLATYRGTVTCSGACVVSELENE